MPFNYDQHIDDYLQDKLNPEDRADFEDALISNKELKEKYNERMTMVKGVKKAGKDELKQRLQRIHQEVQGTAAATIPKRKSLLPYITGAAAAIAILLVGSWMFLSGSSASPQELFANHYEPYDLKIASRNATDELQLAQLNEWYKQENYVEALPLFEAQLKDNPTNAQMLLGAGICQLEINQPAAARKHLNAIISYNDMRLQDIARWYIALSYLKEGDSEKASTYLKSVEKDKKNEATELIEQLLNL